MYFVSILRHVCIFCGLSLTCMYILHTILQYTRRMATTVIARIDFGNVGIRLYEPAFGKNTDDVYDYYLYMSKYVYILSI